MSEVYLGNNSYQKIQEIIQEHDYKKVFLVTNKNSFLTGGVSDYIFQSLIGCQYHRFNNFSVNPKFEELQTGMNEYQDFQPDLIIGVGGGSAMDMAKLIHYMSDQLVATKEEIQARKNKELKSKLMLIPSTSGSGSEATQFSVVYIDEQKYSLDTPCILPDYCIVDGVFTDKLPRNVTAYTGVDALCQAIESYWSKAATKESMDYALKAIELILPNLVTAIKNPNLDAREAMAIGSYYAGAAINITRTTAPHAFSYYLTTHHGYPHGHAVAVVFPYLIEPNDKCVDLIEIYKLFKVNNAKEFKEQFIHLLDEIDLYTTVKKIVKDDIENFVSAVNLERLKNNPAQLTKEEFINLFTHE